MKKDKGKLTNKKKKSCESRDSPKITSFLVTSFASIHNHRNQKKKKKKESFYSFFLTLSCFFLSPFKNSGDAQEANGEKEIGKIEWDRGRRRKIGKKMDKDTEQKRFLKKTYIKMQASTNTEKRVKEGSKHKEIEKNTFPPLKVGHNVGNNYHKRVLFLCFSSLSTFLPSSSSCS